mmetsp:Transcript_25769/g.67480  ORF Transcript_25769/g.67480 Transcript_25769/m.67480 type:complete len:269 (-) Transcript_25769:423-1229(-)
MSKLPSSSVPCPLLAWLLTVVRPDEVQSGLRAWERVAKRPSPDDPPSREQAPAGLVAGLETPALAPTPALDRAPVVLLARFRARRTGLRATGAGWHAGEKSIDSASPSASRSQAAGFATMGSPTSGDSGCATGMKLSRESTVAASPFVLSAAPDSVGASVEFPPTSLSPALHSAIWLLRALVHFVRASSSSGKNATRCTSFKPSWTCSDTDATAILRTSAKERPPRKIPAERREKPRYCTPRSLATAREDLYARDRSRSEEAEFCSTR